MSISWGNFDVRIYAANAWISLAPRFAAEYPVIIDQLEAILADPVPAVRLQAAQNLQVISMVAPDRMWAMGEHIAANETDAQILAFYLSHAMRQFSHSDPVHCEAVLSIVKGRIDNDFGLDHQGRSYLLESLGGWMAQLFAGQGRALARIWLTEWAADPERYSDLLNAFASSLRGTLFHRYAPDAGPVACAMCERAQDGLALILTSATAISAEAYATHASSVANVDKETAAKKYNSAEKVIHHAMNQLYFGSGAYDADCNEGQVGLPDAATKARLLTDYAEILALIASSREPATLHHLIELYEFLICGDPVAVFEAIHTIVLGRGEEEGYHHESLGNTVVVRIVERYIADYRALFDDEGRRARLVRVLQLFSEVGWADALKLLYDLPDLLR